MFTLKFNEKEMEILDEALGHMPYKVVAQLIDNINQQIRTSNAERIVHTDDTANG